MKLSGNLHWLEGQRSNVYLWEGENGLMLVDTGMPGDAKAILSYVQEIGHQPASITTILITHADTDHAGSAAELQAVSGATIYAGAQTAELLTQGKSPKHLPRVMQFVIDHFMGYSPVSAEGVQVVNDGTTVPEEGDWQAVATPGHTLDHNSYYSDAYGILFAGDALNTRDARLQNTPGRITADVEAARRSAMRLLRFHPAIIACGHGRPFKDYDAKDLMALYRDLENQLTASQKS